MDGLTSARVGIQQDENSPNQKRQVVEMAEPVGGGKCGAAACAPVVKRRRVSSRGVCKRRANAATPDTAATPQVGCPCSPAETAAAVGVASSLPLAALAGGPYFTIASALSPRDLCQVDAACQLLSALNAMPAGPWHAAGDRAFFGMELDVGGGFLPFQQDYYGAGTRVPAPLAGKWKERCALFHKEAPTFSHPFLGSEIANVEHSDEVAYCRCRLRTDLLVERPDCGVYVEVEVLANADNLSLAVVDFEGGGRSSVTFSPETGAVLRERKVRESPRAIEGTYIHLLPAAPPGRRFEGTMGLYLLAGHLAFFRRWSRRGGSQQQQPDGADSPIGGSAQWETTGFCTDLKWAQGPRLSMCLAFRDSGEYRVRIARVGRSPPSSPKRSSYAYEEEKWNLLYGDDEHPLAI